MISKGLLSEVMGIHIAHCSECKADSDLFYTDIDGGHYISIYELAHKCKEWAYKQGFIILSGHSAYNIGLFFCSCKGWLSENYDKQIEINHKTEPEAIFQACQWILDNKI